SVNRAIAMLRLDNFFTTIKAMVELDDGSVAKKSTVTVEINPITFGERESKMIRELQARHDACHRVAHEGELEIIVPIIGVKPLCLRREEMLGRCFATPPVICSDHFLDARSSGSLDMNKNAPIFMADHRSGVPPFKSQNATENRNHHN
ncbi:MAG TPA: hypothetical protein VGB93_13360, partial [Methylovirgula sp.]